MGTVIVHHQVSSSNIATVGFSEGVMEVRFKNGGLYRYEGVTLEQFVALKNAESVGRHLNGMGLKGKKINEEAK